MKKENYRKTPVLFQKITHDHILFSTKIKEYNKKLLMKRVIINYSYTHLKIKLPRN